MKKIEAKIVADSINSITGDRVTTFLLTFPRFILSELNMHRMFSKNSASSRAIPFEKMVKMVEEDPFIPIAWQKDHKGMQGSEYFKDTCKEEFSHLDRVFAGHSQYENKSSIQQLTEEWLEARDNAIQQAKALNYLGVTKQLCNRLLEPYMWHTVLLTFTEFENFFNLRCPQYEYHDMITGNQQFLKSKKDWLKYHKDKSFPKALHISKIPETEIEWLQINHSQAEIHMQALAEAMWDAYNESIPKELQPGEWHIPFGDKISDGELRDYFYNIENNPDPSFTAYQEAKLKISTARCARLSYMTFDGIIDYEKDIKLHDKLLESKHFSPFEHCALCVTTEEYNENFKGFKSYRQILEER